MDITDRYVDEVAAEYMETALWSSTDDDDNPLDATYGVDDIAEEARLAMVADVRAFVTSCEEWRPNILDGMEAGQVGHDFWLTRNGHGAGFWDRGLGEVGQWLTDVCKPYGEMYLYVGDDGRIHYGV